MHRNITLRSGSAAPDFLATISAGSDVPVRFPGEDGGESLGAMAQRDLDAALQLLTERAQYITGAAGAAIALRDGAGMICRASVGDCAPALGLRVQIDSGLSGESVRTRQILRCDNAEQDARVNRESCRELGIASVVVMPLVNDDQVSGLFELFSAKPYAFEERDIVALQRLSEMVQTALAHADAAKRTERELAQPQAIEAAGEPVAEPVDATEKIIESPKPAPETLQEDDAPPVTITARGSIGACSGCGFPVSQGRELCVDCEKARANSDDAPAFLGNLGQSLRESWLQSNKYILAVFALAALLVAFLVWLK